MSETNYRLVNVSGAAPVPITHWAPVLVPRAAIEAEIQRLADEPAPHDGRRAAAIVHPECADGTQGFAPGVDVTIEVLRPGEQTRPMLRNSNQIHFGVRGSGEILVGNETLASGQWDVASIPSMQPYSFRNTGKELWVRLVYSNAPLLRKLGVHWSDYAQAGWDAKAVASTAGVNVNINRANAPDIQISPEGARLRGYEFLTDIEVVENRPLVWPWEAAAPLLSRERGDGLRNIILLYNPATERRNGTTHSFFATLFSIPEGVPPRPVTRGHKHSSVAINYHFAGRGKSVVDDETIHWEAGDLLLSGPAWSEHAHYYDGHGAHVLTIQDHPLHIGMESLIWQERMDGPILNLGSEAGQKGYVGPRQAG